MAKLSKNSIDWLGVVILLSIILLVLRFIILPINNALNEGWQRNLWYLIVLASSYAILPFYGKLFDFLKDNFEEKEG